MNFTIANLNFSPDTPDDIMQALNEKMLAGGYHSIQDLKDLCEVGGEFYGSTLTFLTMPRNKRAFQLLFPQTPQTPQSTDSTATPQQTSPELPVASNKPIAVTAVHLREEREVS